MSVRRSITKSVDLRVSQGRAFEYLSDPMNWPKWAVVNMKSVRPRIDGWYETETRQGNGQLKMIASKSHGLLDHMWKESSRIVDRAARVVANGEGCTFMMTFFQPPVMDEAMFEAAALEVDKELSRLKEILESGSAHSSEDS